MKKWRLFLPVGLLALALTATGVLSARVKAQEPEDNTIPDRVYFGDIAGGGLTQEEAVAEIEAYVERMGDTPVTLKAGENTVETTVGEFGLAWSNREIVEEAEGLGKSGNLIARYKVMKDLEHEDKVYEIGFTVEREKIAAVLNQHLEEFNTEAKDGDLKRENGEFVIIPGSQGVTIDVEASAAEVENYMNTSWREAVGEAAEIEMVAEVIPYRGTPEEMGRVKDVLGTYHTNFSSSAWGRCKNLENGAAKLNGSLIYPGEEFSVYEHTSPYDKANGYELAGAYENGRTIDSYGGGICQVSTTLYNAVIRAELDVTMRFPHSMIVTYVNPSQDAAIAGTYKDLRFINNTDSPIYIEGYTSGKEIYFTIYGHETRDPGREVEFVSETTSSRDPGVQFVATGEPIGVINRVQGSHEGKSAKLWKIVKENGVEVSREEFNTSNYNASPAIYEVGTASANADAIANINAAIATQDEATIRAVAAAWNDEALAAAAAAQPQPEPTPPEQPQPEQPQPPAGGGTTPSDGGTTPPAGGDGANPGNGGTTPPATDAGAAGGN